MPQRIGRNAGHQQMHLVDRLPQTFVDRAALGIELAVREQRRDSGVRLAAPPLAGSKYSS